MEKLTKELTSSDICSIIKACGDCGVRSFEQGKLKLVFWEKDKKEVAPVYTVTTDARSGIVEITEKKTSEEDVLTELMINDPAEYERRQVAKVEE